MAPDPIISEELIGRLGPGILPENRKEVARNLEGYRPVMIRIWDRVSRDPAEMRKLEEMQTSKPKSP